MADIGITQQPRQQYTAMVGNQSTLDRIAAAEHPDCVMCSPGNPLGMKLKFKVQPDGSVAALFACPPLLRSYPGTLHGGVISALLDAAMTNTLFSVGIVAVTAELTVRYVAPVNLDRGAVIRGIIDSSASHPLYHMRAELIQDQHTKARATAKFMVKS